jgi:hypothetical protein
VWKVEKLYYQACLFFSILTGLLIMGRLNEILTLAQARATELQLPYAGAMTPQEANEVRQLVPNAAIVDVRTRALLQHSRRL